MLALRRMVQSFRQRNDWDTRRPARGCALRYAMRCLVAPIGHPRWLTLLDAHPALRAAAGRDGRLFERWQHRFISRRIGTHARLRMLMEHHRFAATAFPPGMLERVYMDGRVSLAEASMKNGEPLRVLMMPPVRKGCEGELNLALESADGTLLFSVTMTVLPSSGRLLIGCLQGPPTEDGQERVRHVTRQCHGLRPKNLLLSLVYAFATVHDVEKIRGIGNAAHARSKTIKSSYDTFWTESGGVLAKDGFYDLPAEEAVRNELDVVSKHRSAFRQREALRHDLVVRAIQALRLTGPMEHHRVTEPLRAA